MISTKGRYALRVMIDLAKNTDKEFVPLKDIAQRQNVSKKYLEIIVKALVEGNMLEGLSGKGGGYRLVRKPDEYPVGEILELMEGTLSPVACLSKEAKKCDRASSCETLPMWKEFNDMIHSFFYGRTLADLIR